jgi:hypothetical protein
MGVRSLTLRDEHRLRVFENKVLRIFGPKSDEVTASWRKLLWCGAKKPDYMMSIASQRLAIPR